MRNKFTELMSANNSNPSYGCCQAPHIKSMPEQDYICRYYNNIFGVITDTHMSCDDNGVRIITGHIIGTPNWNKFLYSRYWGGVDVCNNDPSRPCCLADFLSKLGLVGSYTSINNDAAYAVTADMDGYSGDMMPTPPQSYQTTESKIPQSLSNLTTDGNIGHILKCYENSLNFRQVANKLNESQFIRGNNWFSYGDKLIFQTGQTSIIL